MNNIEITKDEKVFLEKLLGLGSTHLNKLILGADGAVNIGDLLKDLSGRMGREPDEEDAKLQAMLDKASKAGERYKKDKALMDSILAKLDKAYFSPEPGEEVPFEKEPETQLQNENDDTTRN